MTTALHARTLGSGPRVVLVHGFTQTSRCWSPVDDRLAADHTVVAVDAPGHGGSAGVSADLWQTAHLITDTGGTGTYVGYSMGGRMCLHAALSRPDAVERLVLVSATAGIDDAEARAERRTRDERLAARVLEIGVAAFVDEWLAQPLFGALTPAQAHHDERLANTAEGLAGSLRSAGTGTQDPLWSRLAELAMPVLVVAGADDAPYVALASRLVEGIGENATLEVIDGAAHTAHLEQPERFLEALRRWWAR